MKDLVIIGAGGFGREMVTNIALINRDVHRFYGGQEDMLINVVGFIDENATSTPEGYPVLGNLEDYIAMENRPDYFIAIANSHAREKIATRLKAAGCKAFSVIHPDVPIGAGAEIGEGCYIGKNSAVMNMVKIGDYCVIQGRSLFGHDATVGDYTSFMTDASVGGETNIGKHCYFGLRCTVINMLNITDDCTFGACACVVKDATVPGTYVGVPAKCIKPLQK